MTSPCPPPPRKESPADAFAKAAARTLDILTNCLRSHPGCSFETKMSPSGTFQVVVRTPSNTQVFFGGDIQDAYAQAAQTIDFNGGTI